MRDFANDITLLVEKPSTRADVVPLYSVAILCECFARPPQAKTTWSVANDAIIRRWSVSGLCWIKEQAWKRAAAKAKEGLKKAAPE